MPGATTSCLETPSLKNTVAYPCAWKGGLTRVEHTLSKGGAVPTPIPTPCTRYREGEVSGNATPNNRAVHHRHHTTSPPPPGWTCCPFPLLSSEHQDEFTSLNALLDRAASISERMDRAMQNEHLSCSELSSSFFSLESSRKRKRTQGRETTTLTTNGEVVVACRLRTMHQEQDSPSSCQGRPLSHPLSFSGSYSPSHVFDAVNYALHRRLHLPPTRPLKGLLKGCAEQNALGAAAAAGNNYIYDLRAMYLIAERWEEDKVIPMEKKDEVQRHHLEAMRGGGPAEAGRSCALRRRPHVSFPCGECWGYLTEIGRLKHALGLPPLELWIQVPKCSWSGKKNKEEKDHRAHHHPPNRTIVEDQAAGPPWWDIYRRIEKRRQEKEKREEKSDDDSHSVTSHTASHRPFTSPCLPMEHVSEQATGRRQSGKGMTNVNHSVGNSCRGHCSFSSSSSHVNLSSNPCTSSPLFIDEVRGLRICLVYTDKE